MKEQLHTYDSLHEQYDMAITLMNGEAIYNGKEMPIEEVIKELNKILDKMFEECKKRDFLYYENIDYIMENEAEDYGIDMCLINFVAYIKALYRVSLENPNKAYFGCYDLNENEYYFEEKEF